ncbi:MAG: phosphotransferase [Alphaproteobacteria bacterium]|nr:phosphotransferase [Alphaproteobacteria bacterium]
MAENDAPDTGLRAAVQDALEARFGSGVGTARFEKLTGGVSCDVWRVDAGARAFCVKRALPKLKVAMEWRAPVERNAYEFRWMETARAIVPDAVPEPIHQDEAAGFIVMEFLEPSSHPLWKAELLKGRVDPEVGRRMGAILAAIHGATARRPELKETFDTLSLFDPLRIDPYLRTTRDRHPELRAHFDAVIHDLSTVRVALIHGDVSPKNILLGPKGPVILDAECAYYGDPAFDLAFCLNHLLLKRLVVPQAREALGETFRRLIATYLDGVAWEDAKGLERRIGATLITLFLARIDGKSPVEYVTADPQKDLVRESVAGMIRFAIGRPEEILSYWEREHDAYLGN